MKVIQYVITWKKSISKFHFSVKLYNTKYEKSYDTKLFITKRSTNSYLDIFAYDVCFSF